MMTADQRKCLNCGEPLQGRTDKKFCDDQCRSQYNNRANSDVTAQMRNINNILRRNRRVLEQALAKNATVRTSMKRLLEAGFNPRYHTHTYETRDGHTYRYCYDYGFLPLKSDAVVVVKWKREWAL